jgi:hypothetical protein
VFNVLFVGYSLAKNNLNNTYQYGMISKNFSKTMNYVLNYTGCPRVAKKLHNLFVIKDINFFFFLDDSYASTAYSENIAVYIQSVPIL